MTKAFSFTAIAALAALASSAVSLVACETGDATQAVIDNDYPSSDVDGGDPSTQTTVYRGWWQTTYFPDPVGAGTEGVTLRTVFATDTAYVVVAPMYNPASSDPPPMLLPMMSAAKLSVVRGDTLHIHVSDATFLGSCAAGKPLSQEQADFITQSIFPSVFAGGSYDAKTCTFTPTADGGAPVTDAGAGGAADGD